MLIDHILNCVFIANAGINGKTNKILKKIGVAFAVQKHTAKSGQHKAKKSLPCAYTRQRKPACDSAARGDFLCRAGGRRGARQRPDLCRAAGGGAHGNE